MNQPYSTANAEHQEYPAPIKFITDAPLALSEAWIDAYRSVILKSQDGNTVIVPHEALKRLLKLIRPV